MPFKFTQLAIPDVYLIEPVVFGDDRGFFMETFKQSAFAEAGIHQEFLQDNHSLSQKGVLRGLHFQKPPHAQGKLVRAVGGEIFDVVVDLRKDSPTFKQWVAATLSAENKLMLYIPPEFAHGFYTVSDEAQVVYKATAEFSPEHDSGIAWNDPDIAVKWPVEAPLVSPKDDQLPTLQDSPSPF